MGEKFTRFKGNLVQIIKNIGSSAGKVMTDFERVDKEIEEKMKKATGSVAEF